MQNLRERIAAERSRLKQVRQALTAAVNQGAGSAQGAEDWIGFYLACGEYMAAAMHRLHLQDVRMTDLLNAKADLSTPEARQAMSELDERLRGNQKFLQQYLAAAEALRQQGVAALDEYESAAKAYTGYIVSNMGHHAGSVDLARAAFSPADWESMAFVSEADAQREEELFQAVFAHKPDALSLEGSESL